MIEHFIPGEERRHIPLAHYLEPMAARVVGRYVEALSQPGSWLLDPFCQSGVLVEEATKGARQPIAAHFSPINVLIARGTLSLPTVREIDAATVRLGDSLKRDSPLREHIRGLYLTSCHRCGQRLLADYYLWDGERGVPVEKYYRCSSCGAEGPAPVDEFDLEVLSQIEDRGFHYWYLLERLSSPGEEGKALARSLLELYTPRNLYALATLTMKAETLFSGTSVYEALLLIFLICLDEGRKSEPEALPRRLSLRPPRSFIERNIWQTFEEARLKVNQLSEEQHESHPLDTVTKGSIRELVRRIKPESIQLIITVPPPLDRSFWALSHLWTGWLLGKEETEAFESLLKPRTLDLAWYERALSAAFQALSSLLHPRGRMVLLVGRGDPSRVKAIVLACAQAGLKLETLLLQQGPKGLRYRLSFSKAPLAKKVASPDRIAVLMRKSALGAMEQLLKERGEPLTAEWLEAATMVRWSKEDLLRALAPVEGVSSAQFTEQRLQEVLDEGLKKGRLVRPEEHPALWVLGAKSSAPPLADRVQEATRHLLEEEMGLEEAQERIYRLFPGLLTPDEELVDLCLFSYGEASKEAWHVRPQEKGPDQKRGILELLEVLGKRLDYQVTRSGLPRYADLAWQDRDSLYLFIVLSSVLLGDLHRWAERGPEANYIVAIPDEMAALVTYRLKRAPLVLKRLQERHWDFLKFGALRWLAGREEMDRHDLKKIVGLRPPLESPEAQLPLFQ